MRPPYKKANIVRDPEAVALWRAEQDERCMVCQHKKCGWLPLSVHHIVRSAGRSDEACNFLLVGQPCHDRCPGHDGSFYPKLTMGEVLTVKVLADPTCYDRLRLEELYGSPLEVEPLPDWLLEKRRRKK